MSEISQLTQHRWLDIFRSFGLDDKTLSGKHCACPMCGGKDRFRVTDYMGTGSVICNQCMPPEESVDGFEFLMRMTSKSFAEIAEEIRPMLGMATARPAQSVDVSKNKARLNKVWTDARPLSKGCPTHRYLAGRGIRVSFADLTGIRCHEGLDYWSMESGKPELIGNWPAMVGLVRDPDGNPATLHITYLNLTGQKAPVDPAKKILPIAKPYKGGAIRLENHQADQVLCIAEGIESALALKTLHPDVCCWACISAGNMKDFVAPDDCSTIYIGGDNDKSFTGQAAAFEIARKLMVKKFNVRVLIPDEQGTDWADHIYQDETNAIFNNVIQMRKVEAKP